MRTRMVGYVLLGAGLCLFALRATPGWADVPINDHYPIETKGEVALSPPHVGQTNECATHVYVNSFVPQATVRVFLNGSTLIGGPLAPPKGYFAVPLTQPLANGDKITATQTVNGVTSVPSAAMVVGAMPKVLSKPTVDPSIYACGRIAAVGGLVSGVDVEVIDDTTHATIGTGFTPNDWGDDWAPVLTPSLTKGDKIVARQRSCKSQKPSADSSPARTVQLDPTPIVAPSVAKPIPGNDVVALTKLYVGAAVTVFDYATPIAAGLATGSANNPAVQPKITAGVSISARQDLCSPGESSTAVTPGKLTAPILVGPICPKQTQVTVRDSTVNAILVLEDNNHLGPIGYGGAAPGDVPLDVAPIATLAAKDQVLVVEYIGSDVVQSNTVVVQCEDVLTYHNDTNRTGWNRAETLLTPADVKPGGFGQTAPTTILDDQTDAQPLVVADQTIDGVSYPSVVFVVTESNTVYAIDGSTGAILKSRTLGPAVPEPLKCNNNGPQVGINGTPAIDLATETLYLISYTLLPAGKPAHQLHALNLATLDDKIGSPVPISASAKLDDGSVVKFDSSVQRQRTALLLASGGIYAGFGSYCDFAAKSSRGWVLGWSQSNLTPFGASQVLNKKTPAQSAGGFLLTAVWMSGFGLAANGGDGTGGIFLTTGNSQNNYSTISANPSASVNPSESMVALKSDLSAIQGFFTPANQPTLDASDLDFGSGGTLVLPDQPGPKPHLAVAAGKFGELFIVDRDAMGGATSPQSSVVVGPCWCGPSYYEGADHKGRVVSSGGGLLNQPGSSVGPTNGPTLMQWVIDTSKTPALTSEATAAALPSKADGGVFTSISSNGEKADSAIIWAIKRPDANNVVNLFAFDATAKSGTLNQIWGGPAGTWTQTNANPNLVPTVANGRVYVGSDQELRIFGLLPPSTPRKQRIAETQGGPKIERAQAFPPKAGLTYWGMIRSVDGHVLTIALRNGQTLTVDITKVAPLATSDQGAIGRHVAVNGVKGTNGVLIAAGLWRVKGPETWGTDSPN